MSGLGPEHSAIEVDDQIRQALEQAQDAVSIAQICRSAALSQGLVRKDIINPEVLIPTEGRQPTRFAKTITLPGGAKRVLEGDSPENLDQQELALYRQQEQSEQTEQSEPPRDEATGRFVSPNDAAVEEYLQTRGIDPAALKEVSEKKYQDSWREATDAFLANHPDWQGGQDNLKVIGEILVQSDLEDAPDKLDALERAYAHAVANGWLTDNPELVQLRSISEAPDHESISRALHRDPFAVRN